MAAVVLILNEEPEGCFECPCSAVIDGKYYLCEVTRDSETDGGEVIDSCPLRPLPRKKQKNKTWIHKQIQKAGENKDFWRGYIRGWNRYRKTLLNGEEEK